MSASARIRKFAAKLSDRSSTACSTSRVKWLSIGAICVAVICGIAIANFATSESTAAQVTRKSDAGKSDTTKTETPKTDTLKTGTAKAAAPNNVPAAKVAPDKDSADKDPLTKGKDESFSALAKRLASEKTKFAKRQQNLLAERYDLADQPSKSAKMSRGKPLQEGVRVKLPNGMTWEKLASLTPAEIKEKSLWPSGFYPLPHPHHEAGGMIFPKFLIDDTKKQTDRDLTRFDLDFDLPDHLLPEHPAAIFLTTRPDLGDVSQGKLVTLANFEELFSEILNPKQLDGLRLLLTPFPQQQFNMTQDRRSLHAHQGVACLDCHANGHTNASTHTVGDIRPNEHRHRIDTPTLRGLNVQRLFGSQRALKTVEDFTEFEQRAAYFDGIPADAARKGMNVLDRGAQVHPMAEFQALLDFPPAPKLNVFGKLDATKASESELRGEEVFFGKGQCATCHVPPYYSDNLMHNLKVERFFKETMINGRKASADGPIKTFPLRGIKDSPPYLHDDRLLTLDDTVEFFNIVLELKLNKQEKQDLVAFLQAL